MAVAELGRAVLELTTDDSKLYSGIDRGEKAAVQLVASFDKVAKAIQADVAQSSQAVEHFGTEITAAFTSVDVGAKGLSSAIQKLVGADAIERANSYAKAVQAIGGVSKLTAAEQQSLAQSTQAALQKYQALGITAPKVLTDIDTAAKAAVAETKRLEQEAAAVAQAFARFSGDKVKQDAIALAKAIDQVGGASKLTKSELSQVNAVVTEAITKYTALGDKAPASLRALEAETARLLKGTADLPPHLQNIGDKSTLTAKATDILKGSVAQLASGFAIGNIITSAVTGLVRWGKEAIDAAGATLDLSNKTGLSTDTIQKMELAAKLTGASLESFTNSAFKLGTRISGGSGSVRNAIEDLGLSWEKIRRMAPDQQFETIAAALGKVENAQDRNKLAIDIFGKSASEILPAIAEGWDQITANANRTSREQLEAIDAMSDAWDTFVANRKKDIGSVLGSLVIATQEAGRLGFLQTASLFATNFQAAPGMLAGMGAVANQQAKKPESVDLPTEPIKSYVAALKEAQAAVAALSKTTVDEIFAAEKLGKGQDEIVNRFGITEETLSLLKERYSENKTAMNQAEAAAKKLAEAQERVASASEPVIGAQRDLVLWLAKRNASEADIAKTLDLTATQVKGVIELEKARTDALKLADKQAQEFVANQRKLMDASAKVILDSVAAIRKLDDQIALQGTSGLNRRLVEINQAEAAEIRAIENVGDVESEITRQRKAKVYELYDYQRKLALGTSDTIVARMREQGVVTASELRQQAAAFARDYGQMKESGLYTYGQLEDAAERAINAQIAALGLLEAKWMRVASAVAHFGGQIGEAIGGDRGQALSGLSNNAGNLASMAGKNVAAAQAAKASGIGMTTASLLSGIGTVYAGYTLGVNFFKEGGYWDKLRDNLTSHVRAAEIEARGGERAIQLAGTTAGATSLSNAALNATHTKDFQRALKGLDQAVAENDARLQRYGLTWRDLGSSIKKANIEAETRQLIADSHAFYMQGLNVDQQVKAMSSGLNQMVIDATTTGQKIPAALQPMLETLIRSGKLSEEAAAALLGIQKKAVPAFKDIEAAAARYGIEIGKLGKAVQQIKIDDLAAQIIADWNLLQDAGGDTNTILVGMQKSVQDVVTEALKAGVKIPAGLQPIIAKLIEAGLLTDENGDKLTDLGQLEFEKPLTEAIDLLIKKLDELIDKFSDVGTSAEAGFGRAAAAGATATGEVAVPRGGTDPGSGDSGTASTPPPSPSTTSQPAPAPEATPAPSGGAVPRGGSNIWNPAGQVLTMPDGSTRVLGDVTANNPTRRYAKGGVVEPTYAAKGSVIGDAQAATVKWIPKGTDDIPAMLTRREGVLNVPAMDRLGIPSFEALNTGRPLPPESLLKLFDISALLASLPQQLDAEKDRALSPELLAALGKMSRPVAGDAKRLARSVEYFSTGGIVGGRGWRDIARDERGGFRPEGFDVSDIQRTGPIIKTEDPAPDVQADARPMLAPSPFVPPTITFRPEVFEAPRFSIPAPAPQISTMGPSATSFGRATSASEGPVTITNHFDFSGSYIDNERTADRMADRMIVKMSAKLRKDGGARDLWRTPIRTLASSQP